MLGYLSADIICSEWRTVFRERSSRKTVSYKEQIMSKNKYTCIFSPQMEAIVFIILQIFYATPAVLKIGEYPRMFPSFSWGNIHPCDASRPIARERKYLMDYKLAYLWTAKTSVLRSQQYSKSAAQGKLWALIWGADNVQCVENTFTTNGGCGAYPSNIFLQHTQFCKFWKIAQIFNHVMCLDQSRASKKAVLQDSYRYTGAGGQYYQYKIDSCHLHLWNNNLTCKVTNFGDRFDFSWCKTEFQLNVNWIWLL